MVWQAKNLAFDREVLIDQIGGLNLGLPGQYYDSEKDNWQNGFRDYDVKTARYLQSDPIGLAGGNNLYRYALNSSLIWFDETGLGPKETGGEPSDQGRPGSSNCGCSIKGEEMGGTNSGALTQEQADNLNAYVANTTNNAGLVLVGASLKLPPGVSATLGALLWYFNREQHQWKAGDQHIQRYWYSENGEGIITENMVINASGTVVISNSSSYYMEE
ncbi:RHS repeat-associated core domain-containing protein [Shewanella sp.]|nr:RHS repeat-associated core domain-containing protein [Shewanella sp.]